MQFLEYFNDLNLNIILAMCYFVILGVLCIIYPLYKKEHIKFLIIGHALIAIAISMLSLRNIAPDIISIVIGNMLLLGGEYLIIVGFLKAVNRKIKYKYLITSYVIFTIIHIYFTYVVPNVNYRIVNFSVFMILAIMMFMISYMGKLKHQSDIPYVVIWLTYLLFILNHFARMINAIAYEVINQLFRDANILKLIY
ncbi:MAG: hypothetical protein JEZ08_13525 [Clostridiales bacterium]|nr:hypothetical protein [Clostridiales bacterium]